MAPAPAWTLVALVALVPLAGAAGWPMGPRDLDGSRHAEDAGWDAAAIGALALAWSFQTDGSLTGTPTFDADRVYVGSWKGMVYALDARDGSLVWSRDVGGQVDAAITLWEGLAFAGDNKGRLHALDATSGEPVWSVTVDTTKSTHLYATPIVVPSARGDLLVMAVASDQESIRLHGDAPVDFRGSVVAYDARTGAEVWRTTLIPEGFTGAPVWGTPIYDAMSGFLLFGTGNAYTEPAHNITDAVVAMEAETGRIAWSFQATRNDVFTQKEPKSVDDDFGSTGSLFPGPNGERLFAIGQKSSVVRAFHVVNGTLAWRNGSSSPGEGIIGASAYANGLLAMPYTNQKRVTVFDAPTGQARWSHELGGAVYSGPAIAAGALFVGDTSGNLTALDLASGDVLWTGGTGGMGTIYGGVSVAGDLLLVPVVDSAFLGEHGHVLAFAPNGTAKLPEPPTPTPPATPPEPGAPAAVVNEMLHSEFEPEVLEIDVGDEVEWRNLDPFAHVVLSGWDDGAALDAYVDVGESTRFRFDAPGDYLIVCPLHATPNEEGDWAEGMLGRVVVRAASAEPPLESGAGIGQAVPGLGVAALVAVLIGVALRVKKAP